MNSGPTDSNLEQWLIGALTAIDDGLAVYDADGQLTFCNDSFRRINRYTIEDSTPGVATYDSLGELDFENTKDGRVPMSFAQRVGHLRRDGPVSLIQTYDHGIYQRDLSLTPTGGLVSITTDITALKRAQHEAEVANDAKSEFLASISHEFRTPLNAIVGFADLIASETFGPHSDPKYQAYANDILQSGNHLISLVNNTLDIAKIESGKFDLNLGQIELPDAIDTCIRMIDGGDREIEVRISNDVSPLITDVRMFNQVMINVLSNADKYTPADGRIYVSAEHETDGRLCIKIVDTGIGIAAEHIPLILEPFGQVRTSANIAHEGTGLGLTLSLKMMQRLGGTLEIESAPGTGTTVTLTFPPEQPPN